MMHVTFGDKTLFMGDEPAETLLQYAALLADRGHADTVKMTCIGADGNTVDVLFLLDPGTQLVAESTNSELNEPDSQDAVRYMKERIAAITDPPNVQPLEHGEITDFSTHDF